MLSNETIKSTLEVIGSVSWLPSDELPNYSLNFLYILLIQHLNLDRNESYQLLNILEKNKLLTIISEREIVVNINKIKHYIKLLKN